MTQPPPKLKAPPKQTAIKPGGSTPPPVPPGPPKRGVRPLAMASSQSSVARNGYKVCYWGPSGTGKTVKLGSWPNLVVLHCDPDDGTLRSFEHPIMRIDVSDWAQFDAQILPLLRNRTLHEQVLDYIDPDTGKKPFAHYSKNLTIGVDSFTYLAQNIIHEEAKRREPSNSMRGWGEYLDLHRKVFRDLVSITIPRNGVYYNLVGTVHERETYRTEKDSNGQDQQILDAIGPSVQGQFFGEFFQHFSAVLICRCEIPHTAKGDLIKNKEAQWVAYTIPIDNFRRGIDRYGGGRFARLPAKTSGMYPELAEYWEK